MFVEMVREAQEVAVVYIVVQNTASMSNCNSLLLYNGVPIDNIEYVFHAMDAMWSRDYGPHFIWGQTSGEIAMIDWQYYDSRPNDDEIPDYMADLWHMNFYETPIYHEGGNYMSDGHGTVMCSNVLYLNNPSWSHARCQQELMDYFGATSVHIYERIPDQWDMTGHIDLWAKMLNDTTIMVAQTLPGEPNYNLIEQHAAAMAQVPTIYGTPFNVVRCPMPPPYQFYIWNYYKSFINSVIINGKILVPIYTTEPALTAQALAAHEAAMPDYEVVGIYSDNIAPMGGAIHCTTIGIADHIEDYYHNATITATPVSPPITIPAGGGNFDFDASLVNNETDSIYTEVWSEVTLPNSSVIGPILHKYLAMAGNGAVSRSITQYVPPGAPAGMYTYTMYTGSRLPRVVNDEASFTFTKSAVDGIPREDLVGWWTEEFEAPAETVNAINPTDYTLVNVYPNPFNPATVISYQMPDVGLAKLNVFNVQGRLVAELVNGWQDAGQYEVTFDASHLTSGVYVYRLETRQYTVSGKMVLMK
jgi:agmatine/peptidylarginine deiminase